MAICDFCNKKKVSLIPFTCKCGYNKLCTCCRMPEQHKCKYDYIGEGKKELIINNPIIVKDKLNLI
jgi:hypothetical protein